MPREDLTLYVGNGFQTLAPQPDAAYFEKRGFFIDAVGPSNDPQPALTVRRIEPSTGARTNLLTVTKSGDVNFTNTTFEAGDGTSGAPSYTFSSEPTLGFYRQGAAVIGVSGGLNPATDGGGDLGTLALSWNALFLQTALLVGATPAGAGAVRLTNGTGVYGRNAANTGDVPLVFMGGDNQIYLASSAATSGVVVQGSGLLRAEVAVQVGTSNFATVGAVRLQNNSAVYGRNAANTLDIDLIYLSTSNIVALGTGASGVQIGTNPATAGILRLPNNQYIQMRNNANSSDIIFAYLFTSDEFYVADSAVVNLSYNTGALNVGAGTASAFVSIGTTAAQGGVLRLPNNKIVKVRNAANSADANLIYMNGSDIIQLAENGQQITISGNIVAPVSFFSVGTTPATQGVIRIPNAQSIYGRNAANSANINAIVVNASNQVSLDNDGTSTGIFHGAIGIFPASATGAASIRLPHGAAPSAPVNGDIWTTTAGLFARINGATVGPYT